MAELQKQYYTDYGLDFLPSYWLDKPIASGVLKSFLEAFETPIDLVFEILNGVSLADSEGVQLDVIGYLWDVARDGRSDSNYRSFLFSAINGDIANGTIDKIKELLLASYGEEVTILSYEHFPGNITIYLDGTYTPSLKILGKSITVAGVSFNIKFPPYEDNKSGVRPSANAYVTQHNTLNRSQIINQGVNITPASGIGPDGLTY